MTTILLAILVLGLAPILIAGIQESCLVLFHVFETLFLLLALAGCLAFLAGMLWLIWTIRDPIF